MYLKKVLHLTNFVAVLGATVALTASPIVYSGADVGANSTDPRPVSTATAAAFDAAAGSLGSITLIDFESVTLGAFTSLTLAPGVTLTGSNAYSASQTIEGAPVGTPDRLYGYNTTAGGHKFASYYGGTMTFTFSTTVQAFGAYFSGVQLGGETITYTDGSTEIIGIPGISSGIAFVGFTDAGRSIASITIDATGDIIGMDDVRIVNNSSRVPDGSATIALLGLGFVGLAMMRRKAAKLTA